METFLRRLIFVAGIVQMLIPIASAMVPIHLKWRTELMGIPKLHRQLYWTYGGYIVLAIVSFALICLFNSNELANGSRLARSLCAYMMAFWAIRLSLQTVLEVKPHLTVWWLKAGYHLLTVAFVFLTSVFAVATFYTA